MRELYNLIKKSIPNCCNHTYNKAEFYNKVSENFVCEQCVQEEEIFKKNKITTITEKNEQSQQPRQQSQNSFSSTTTIEFLEIEKIINDPILLLSKSTSYAPNEYYAYESIMKNWDNVLKAELANREAFEEYSKDLKTEVNNYLDRIANILEINQKTLENINKVSEDLRIMKKTYSDQFLEEIEDKFINGTSEELKEIFRNYQLVNEAPFNSISEKINKITSQSKALKYINWEYLSDISDKICNPEMWRIDKVLKNLMSSQSSQSSESPSSLLVGNSSSSTTRTELFNNNKVVVNEQSYLPGNSFIPLGMNGNEEFKDVCHKLSLKFLRNSIELYEHINNDDDDESNNYQGGDNNESHQHLLLDKLSLLEPSEVIDTLYELPRKALLTTNYNKICIYSYQRNQLIKVNSLDVKGCRDILIFKESVVLLSGCKIYHIQLDILLKGYKGEEQNRGESLSEVKGEYEGIEYDENELNLRNLITTTVTANHEIVKFKAYTSEGKLIQIKI